MGTTDRKKLTQQIRFWARELRARWPLSVSPRIRIVDGLGYLGHCRWTKTSSSIRLAPNPDLGNVVDALIHEWTHLWLFEHCPVFDEENIRHGPIFDLMFGRIKRSMSKDDWDFDPQPRFLPPKY